MILTAMFINKANTEGTLRLSFNEIGCRNCTQNARLPFSIAMSGGERQDFQSKMKGNGCKMIGNECNMKGYEWNLKGNEWKMKGNTCKMKGHECKMHGNG